MRKAERFRSAHSQKTPRTLSEVDYIMGVTDVSRMGALRFQYPGQSVYEAPETTGVPQIVDLGRLLQITHRVLNEQVDADDLKILFAPGTSLGGARPKASVLDQCGALSIAKFPKEQDEYSIERWEAVAMCLAEQAGIHVASYDLIEVMGKPVYLSRRFDRHQSERVPWMSAMSMLGLVDGERSSYLDLVDVIGFNSVQADVQRKELFRRMVFNILISNVDDHMRNHGFLRVGAHGWQLSPAYDLNPTPQDIKPRVLTTNINSQDGACDINLALEVAELFDIGKSEASQMIREVAVTTSEWRSVARRLGAGSSEINRMASAFEHQALRDALSTT